MYDEYGSRLKFFLQHLIDSKIREIGQGYGLDEDTLRRVDKNKIFQNVLKELLPILKEWGIRDSGDIDLLFDISEMRLNVIHEVVNNNVLKVMLKKQKI